jgi:Spy/CpxP family protein refolding chaperone
MKMKKLLISLSVASLLSVSTYSINAHERDPHRDNQRELMASLSLSQQQKEDLKQIHLQTRQDLSIYRAQQKQFRDIMRTLMQEEIWNEMAVTNAIEQQMELTLQSRLIRAKSKNQVFNQLTAQQQTQLITSRHARKGDDRAKNPERQLLRLVNVLNLNSDQQAQLMVMMTNDKAQREANKAQIRSVKAELAGILHAKQFDESAWFAVNAQSKQQKLERAVNKAKSRFYMLSVLSTEQRENFNSIMKKSKQENRSKKRGEGFDEENYLSS